MTSTIRGFVYGIGFVLSLFGFYLSGATHDYKSGVLNGLALMLVLGCTESSRRGEKRMIGIMHMAMHEMKAELDRLWPLERRLHSLMRLTEERDEYRADSPTDAEDSEYVGDDYEDKEEAQKQ